MFQVSGCKFKPLLNYFSETGKRGNTQIKDLIVEAGGISDWLCDRGILSFDLLNQEEALREKIFNWEGGSVVNRIYALNCAMTNTSDPITRKP